MIQQSHSWGKKKNTNLKKMHLNVHRSIIYNCQDREQSKCPSIDDWIKNLWYVYTMECYSAIKRNAIWPFATIQMNLKERALSDITQKEKTKYSMTSLICRI